MSTCNAFTLQGHRCQKPIKTKHGQYGACYLPAHIKQVQALTSAEAPSTKIPGRKQEYLLGKSLGKGVYGTVYEVAVDDQSFALKIQESEFDTTRLSTAALVEIDILTRYQHPYLMPLIEAFPAQDGGRSLYHVMPKSGRSLLRYPRENSAELLTIFYQLTAVLEFLHQHGIIHADLKPENILLNPGPVVQLTDLGLAQYDKGQPKTTSVQTYWYRAPEVFRKEKTYTSAIDLWSLGLIMYETIIGTPILGKASERRYLQELMKLLGDPIDVGPLLANRPRAMSLFTPEEGAELVRLINGCLRPSPEERFTATQVLSSSLFANHPRVNGTVLPSTPLVDPPTTIHNFLTEVMTRFPRFHTSTATLAGDLFTRARPLLGELHEEELALGCLDLAARLNQRLDFLPREFNKQLKHCVYTEEELWTLLTKIVESLEFRLHRNDFLSPATKDGLSADPGISESSG